MPVDEQTRIFIQHKLQNNEVPTQIIETLVQGGWNQQQAITAVQEVSGVQVAAAAGPGGYTKPPLILNIAFILSFLLLLLGISLGVYTIVTFLQFGSNSGGLGVTLSLVLGLMSSLYIFGFFVIKDLKNGSWKAFKILSIITLIGFLASVWIDYRGSRYSPNIVSSIGVATGQHILPILFLMYVGKKHRSYFQ